MEANKSLNKGYQYVSLKRARCLSPKIDFQDSELYIPLKPGVKVFNNFSLKMLREYIDWTPFFHAWGMKGKYPDILYAPDTGEEATRIFEEANELMNKIIDSQLVRANGVFGLFPANSSCDDIIIFEDEKRHKISKALPMLRQQKLRSKNKELLSLSDFLAPVDTGKRDYLGAFAVSAGIGADSYVDDFKKKGDHYNSIMFRLVCDRLTEAFAEKLHEMVRKYHWGYSSEEQLSKSELLKEKFQGIRPAPGYPACPDHTLKSDIFELLQVTENTGITLSSGYAMHPASSVTGFYFAHPQTNYFGVGKISRQQVLDYARRKGWTEEEAEKWLAPNLNYEKSLKI